MSNLQMWSLIVGFFMPLVLALGQQPRFPVWVRSVIMFCASLVAGVGVAYFEGTLTGKTWVQAALIVLVATIATYKGFWKPTGVAPAIEQKTTV